MKGHALREWRRRLDEGKEADLCATYSLAQLTYDFRPWYRLSFRDRRPRH